MVHLSLFTLTITILLSILPQPVLAYTCGDNRIPYGIEIYRNGQPALLCSRPNCFEHIYTDCDERALRKSCDSNSSWIGGIQKDTGSHQPLYVQCCEFEGLPSFSDPLYSGVIIRPGEYFEGEEILDKEGDKIVAFDFISDLRQIPNPNSTTEMAYQIDIRRLRCSDMIRPKRYKPWHWP